MNKKWLSQNWLSDEEALDSVIKIAEVQKQDVVLEIGPGPGGLTQALLDYDATVYAVEFDKFLADQLKQKFSEQIDSGQLTVFNEDFINFDLNQLPTDFKVVANIPYHITSKILDKLLTSKNKPKYISLLVQKEVAQRIAAKQGSLSIMAINAQLKAEVTLGRVVKAELFEPVPKVDSQIVGLKPFQQTTLEVDETLFFRVVKAGFSQKRKKLINSLSAGMRVDKGTISSYFEELKIPLNSRAQQLNIEDWQKLALKFNN